jgi:hypothetical protein
LRINFITGIYAPGDADIVAMSRGFGTRVSKLEHKFDTKVNRAESFENFSGHSGAFSGSPAMRKKAYFDTSSFTSFAGKCCRKGHF